MVILDELSEDCLELNPGGPEGSEIRLSSPPKSIAQFYFKCAMPRERVVFKLEVVVFLLRLKVRVKVFFGNGILV